MSFVRNPNFRAVVDTNTVRTEINAELASRPTDDVVTFTQLRRRPALTNLTNQELAIILTGMGLDFILER